MEKTASKNSSELSATNSSTSESAADDLAGLSPFDWKSVALVGREEECKQLLEALHRVSLEDSGGESFFLRGGSGVGKSSLLKTVLEQQSEPLLWASGKFDENEENQLPFAALINATTELVHGIIASPNIEQARDRIKVALREDELLVLSDTFSIVRLLFPDILAKRSETSTTSHVDSNTNESASKSSSVANESTIIRALSIYRRFLCAVATEQCPLVLFLDDLQWADSSSRKLLDSILKDNMLKNILMVGAVREGEKTTFDVPVDASFRTTEIKLSNLTEDDVNVLVSKALEQAQTETGSLSNVVFQRTMGNPYFVRQFLETLYHEDLLIYEAGKCQWDVNAIAKKMKPSVGVVDMLVDRIKALDRNSQLVLVIASTLGHAFTEDVLEPITTSMDLISLFPADLKASRSSITENYSSSTAASTQPVGVGCSILGLNSKQISKCLSKAVRSHLLEFSKDKKQYRFTHDRVQQAAYSLLPSGVLGRHIKCTLGKLMLELSSTCPDEVWMLFAAANLLIKHGSKELLPTELAQLCVKASSRSIGKTAFDAAGSYAESGIKALGDSCWQDDTYSLCLELHNLAVESHFVEGRLKRAKKRIGDIRKHSRTLDDKFRAFNVLLQILLAEQDFKGCIAECLSGLEAVGVKTPKRASSLAVISSLIKTKRLMRNKTAKDLEDLPMMESRALIEACGFVGHLGKASWYLGDTNRFIICCLQLFQLIVKHGLNGRAPGAVACYGIVITYLGDLESAYEIGVTASKLANRPDLAAGMAQGESMSNFLLIHLKRPLVECRDWYPKAVKSAFEHGDAEEGCGCILSKAWLGVYTGTTLIQHEKEMKRTMQLFKEYKNRTMAASLMPFAQLVENLRGKTASPSILTGTYMDEKKFEASFDKEDQNTIKHMQVLSVAQSIILYLTEEHVEAEKLRIKAEKLNDIDYNFNSYYRDAFLALNCFEMVRQTKKAKLLGVAKKYVKRLQFLGKAGSPTSAAILPLLEAEKHMCQGKPLDAAEKYSESIRLLGEGELYMLEAVACERLGMCLQGIDEESSRVALQQAWEKFRIYGAVVKADQIAKKYRHLVDVGMEL